MKKLNHEISLLLWLPFILIACNTNEQERKIDIITDGYIMKTEISGEARFAAAFHAYGNTSLSSVTVTPPPGAGTPFQLTQNSESSFAFYKEPSLDEYKAEWPVEGSYQFKIVTNQGEDLEQTDFLEKIDLDVPKITSTHFDKNFNTLKVKWGKVEDSVGSVVLLINAEGEILYNSDVLAPSIKEYVIGYPDENWSEMPMPGDNLSLRVQAFAYESDATLENNIFNMGIISFNKADITWGQ